jgi:hypothetical protein
MSLAGSASARLITFDDLANVTVYQNIPNPYEGFDWSSHFRYLNGADYPFSRRMPFELDSFYLAAAWRDGLEVTMTGKLNGVTVDSTTLTVNQSGPTLETFNNWDVNEVVLQSFGGASVGWFDGYQFVLDNLTISPVPEESLRVNSFGAVPESSTRALMLLGFAGVGCAAYSRSKRRRLATPPE